MLKKYMRNTEDPEKQAGFLLKRVATFRVNFELHGYKAHKNMIFKELRASASFV